MILKVADWCFRVNVTATKENSIRYSEDHCTCAYCQNYYDTVEQAYPGLKKFLGEFGIDMHGPVEVMPFEPTLFMACYRVCGQIRTWGFQELWADGVSVVPESGDEETFLLWVGELELPWVQSVSPEDVVSPANYPEFLDRMKNIWQLRHSRDWICS